MIGPDEGHRPSPSGQTKEPARRRSPPRASTRSHPDAPFSLTSAPMGTPDPCTTTSARTVALGVAHPTINART